MANTLTNLIPVMYEGFDLVANELTGMIPSVDIDAKASQAAVGQTITSYATPVAATGDVTPGQLPPDDGDQTLGTIQMSITNSKYSPIRWSGEELKGYAQNGMGKETLAKQFAQSIRAIRKLVEIDLCALSATASRAAGTAGATPFASDLRDPANCLKILLDNGAPGADMQMIIGTTAGAKLRSLSQLTKANEAGTTDLRAKGTLLNLDGFTLRESAQIGSHTAGTGTGYLVNNVANYAVGATTIAADTGTGTILAGDFVTFTGDTNQYLVTTALSAGSFTIAAPGLLLPLNDETAITVGSTGVQNFFFERDAIKLLARTPAMPEEGDMADDVHEIQDPLTGLVFQVAVYRLYRRVKYEVGLAWGVKNVKPEFTGVLLG